MNIFFRGVYALLATLSLLATLVLGSSLSNAGVTVTGKIFWHFESGQVRPLALSPNGTRIFSVNTPDNHLEIYSVTPSALLLAKNP